MYGMMFGTNDQADVILATLGLTRGDVGRFRDCGVADGKVYVYTRNGGGNRECWHDWSPESGNPRCKHRVEIEMVDEWVRMPKAEAVATGKTLGAHYVHAAGVDRDVKTGRQVEQTNYVCLNPGTEDCYCVGCFMAFHVAKLAHYSHDQDDDFDRTYATIWFDFPPEYADALGALDRGEKFDPDERWLALIDALKGGSDGA